MTRLGLSETVVSRMPNNLSQSRLTNELSICHIKTAIFLRVFFVMRLFDNVLFSQAMTAGLPESGVPDSPRQSRGVLEDLEVGILMAHSTGEIWRVSAIHE